MISVRDMIMEGKKLATVGATTGAVIGAGGLASHFIGKKYLDDIDKEGIKKNVIRVLSDPTVENKAKIATQAQDLGLPVAALGATILGGSLVSRLASKKK